MVVLILIVIVLVVVVVRLQHALEAVREDLANARLDARTDAWSADRLETLQQRVTALEASLRTRPEPTPTEVAEAPPVVAVSIVIEEPPVIIEEPPFAAAAAAEPVLADVTPAPPPPSPAPLPPPPRPAVPVAPAPAPQEGWEVVVGTSWLNKIGVVVFVVGLALLLGYSMANVGALGRVAIGYALSLGMLGTGVVLERRETYRNYAYGLLGGGWAGVYFTTYAMHAVPAALVVESQLVGSLSLVLVATGMIVHSLRYQSQTLTGLAYVSAYAPLAFSPLSTFSLAATVPLTTSLLAVASRFSWSGVSVLGIASTYSIFILRTSVLGAMPGTTALQMVLWTYWLLFEIADISARRRTTTKPAPLFVLNAAGFLGSILLHTQGDESQWLLIGAAAAAYAASALVRARFTADTTQRPDEAAATTFSTAHAAIAVAAALFAYAIELRFSGTRQTVAWLLETQLLVAAGVALADRQIRRIGTAVAVLTTLHVVATLLGEFPASGFHSVLATSPTAFLVAAVWYGNREWLRRRGLALDALEHVYTWVALFLVLDVIARELPGAYRGSAALAFAVVLLESGFRRATEYRYQAYVALAAASTLAGVAFFLDPLLNNRGEHFDRDVWIALPVLIALAYGFAARVARHRGGASGQPTEFAIVAAAVSTIGTGFLAVFERHVTPIDALGAVWTGTAAAVTAFGAWRGGAVFRWQGYAFAVVASVLVLARIALTNDPTFQQHAGTIVSVVFLYLVAYVGRSASPANATLEPIAAGFIAFLGNALQALFVWRFVPRVAVAPIWAASSALLVTLGVRRRRPWQRWQAYGLVALATLQATLMVAAPPESTREILAGAIVVALAYLVGYLGRAPQPRATAAGETETLAVGLLSYLASFHLAFLIHEFLPPSRVAAAWVTAAIALVALGVWRGRAGQRWQAYGFFAASVGWMLLDLAADGTRDVLAILWMGFSVLAIYVTAMVIRPVLRGLATKDGVSVEETARVGLLVAATVVLSALLMDEVGTRLATLAWALQGAALLVVGFLARERVLRLSGLALLFLCILKLFAYDLRQLEALARIMSFVVLGLVLLTVSWVYTRYREQIRKLL